eukprot:CAMPEP_0172532512 /NCGR_PEP_ID=MMETSP1067-20121228/5545_1 /TAXON_ID=265564 ORGANISM="Thalassiosira punctigera, Strain Tpunct2005C2" /NCGR_SAMPLE_ID=MMETSP1067 /ASSEMBLY_ACC=CAM_ASM_000444 /LENGTH=196 /DNA_ID=CAMNT_0013317043 /DNA_START=239 /DNA_END=827 /DNA_ORIENTATION=-
MSAAAVERALYPTSWGSPLAARRVVDCRTSWFGILERSACGIESPGGLDCRLQGGDSTPRQGGDRGCVESSSSSPVRLGGQCRYSKMLKEKNELAEELQGTSGDGMAVACSFDGTMVHGGYQISVASRLSHRRGRAPTHGSTGRERVSRPTARLGGNARDKHFDFVGHAVKICRLLPVRGDSKPGVGTIGERRTPW